MYLLFASCILSAAISWSAAKWYYTSGEVNSMNGWRAFYILLFIDFMAVIYVHLKWIYSGRPWPVSHSTPRRQSPVRRSTTESALIANDLLPAHHRVRDPRRVDHHEPGEHSSRYARQIQMPDDIEELTVNDLKQVLKSKGYKQTGGKAELIYID